MAKQVDMDSTIMQMAKSWPTIEEVAKETGLPLSDAMDRVEKLVQSGVLAVFRPTQTGMKLKPLHVKPAK